MKFRRFLYVFLPWTWGLPPNLVGLGFFLFYRIKGCSSFPYQGTRVTIWTNRTGSMSMGRYLFLEPCWTPSSHRLLAHEYGHTIQSLFFLPLYLLTVGLPSLLWAGLPCFRKMRRKGRSYYSVYPEKGATRLGERYAKPIPTANEGNSKR